MVSSMLSSFEVILKRIFCGNSNTDSLRTIYVQKCMQFQILQKLQIFEILRFSLPPPRSSGDLFCIISVTSAKALRKIAILIVFLIFYRSAVLVTAVNQLAKLKTVFKRLKKTRYRNCKNLQFL